MLSGLTPDSDNFQVVRLSAVTNRVIERLLDRGIDPRSFREILDRLKQQHIVFEPTQLIDEVFAASTNPSHPTPFKPTRFTDGHKPVFYSAKEDETSIEEIKYWQIRNGEFEELQSQPDASPRYFWLYEIEFSGQTLDLFQIHQECPELTSEDEAGYPKCREIAEQGRAIPVDAFKTPSARHSGGTCTPVFQRPSLVSNPVLKSSGRFRHANGRVVFEVL